MSGVSFPRAMLWSAGLCCRLRLCRGSPRALWWSPVCWLRGGVGFLGLEAFSRTFLMMLMIAMKYRMMQTLRILQLTDRGDDDCHIVLCSLDVLAAQLLKEAVSRNFWIAY